MFAVQLPNVTLPLPKFKKIGEYTIAYRDIGRGEVIFCIPPWPSGSAAFTYLGYIIADKYRTIAIDLPGWGGNSPLVHPGITFAEYLDIISQFIESFGVRRYHLMCYSYGGIFTQALLERDLINPEDVIYISIISSGKEIKEEQATVLRSFEACQHLHVKEELMRKLTSFYMLYIHAASMDEVYPGIRDTQYFKQIIDEDFHADLHTIFDMLYYTFDKNFINPAITKYKSLIICAEKDPQFVRNCCKELAEYVAAPLVEIPMVDHDHLSFAPFTAAQKITEFLYKEPWWRKLLHKLG